MPDAFEELQEVTVLACRACGALDPGPRELCTRCGSTDLESKRVAGTGTLVSSTMIRRPAAAFRGEGAFEVCVVDLDAGPRITGRLMPDGTRGRGTTEPDNVEPGQRVTLTGQRGEILYFAGNQDE
ncbi:Zn-ribbon domain-containing OB-fold protein [Saliniramus sp.]|uniref:Zn-ribbon domain-containing OB-fold protein n=1 Tax=Saliniramus sp. TaxID=2986772 RepID=UPI0039C98E08